ncbi:MAG: helix-turn-helix domain-containing protein [Oscillospiraceae bacterium]|nr:helix-turn-helix domain-containing protein [Oscillospiraceae bacterium]
MPNKIFQPAIVEMKESTSRTLGVIDENGSIIACSDSSLMGLRWGAVAAEMEPDGSGCFRVRGYTFKVLRSVSSGMEFAAFVEGVDELAQSLCGIVAAGLNSAKDYYDEKHDRATFIKHILLDNVLPGDIYMRSREWSFDGTVNRAVFLVRQTGEADSAVVDILKGLFPERHRDFVISMGEKEVALVKEIDGNATAAVLYSLAVTIEDTLRSELMVSTVIGIGSVCKQIKDLAASYKEAEVAIEVGKVFDTAKSIVAYESLGLGRLIYQLPTRMCEMFLTEIFKKNGIDVLDRETLDTILCFFDNSLNISETSRKLFVHRNTLVYRLEKIRKLTGLDLREFDHAVVFKVALMVHRYLASSVTE